MVFFALVSSCILTLLSFPVLLITGDIIFGGCLLGFGVAIRVVLTWCIGDPPPVFIKETYFEITPSKNSNGEDKNLKQISLTFKEFIDQAYNNIHNNTNDKK